MHEVDAISWLLLLIIGACIIILVMIAKKRKEAEDYLYDELDESEYGTKPATLKSTMKAAKSQPTIPQITVYQYYASGQKKRCIVCDGENDTDATRCCICGQRMK